MDQFPSVSGTVVSIESVSLTTPPSDCTLIIGVQNAQQQLTNFIVDLDTCIIDQFTLKKGDSITAFYDASLPTPLIYPPRYHAVVISKNYRHFLVKVDYFNEELISSDHTLKLNVTNRTRILLPNNQLYLGKLGNQYLAVIYNSSTKSIPAQTNPFKVIVLCRAKVE